MKDLSLIVLFLALVISLANNGIQFCKVREQYREIELCKESLERAADSMKKVTKYLDDKHDGEVSNQAAKAWTTEKAIKLCASCHYRN